MFKGGSVAACPKSCQCARARVVLGTRTTASVMMMMMRRRRRRRMMMMMMVMIMMMMMMTVSHTCSWMFSGGSVAA
jgi:hypothetical protein